MNPEIAVSSTGGGNSVGLKTDTIPVTLAFAGKLAGVRDERTGKDLGERFGVQVRLEDERGDCPVVRRHAAADAVTASAQSRGSHWPAERAGLAVLEYVLMQWGIGRKAKPSGKVKGEQE